MLNTLLKEGSPEVRESYKLFLQSLKHDFYKTDRCVINGAFIIAINAHKGQARKVDKLPYITHPLTVATKLSKYIFPAKVIAAALVHDVLEDTDYPECRIKEKLGTGILSIVKSVTNNNTLTWEDKKLLYIESVKNGPDEAKAVCAADKIHNFECLLINNKKYGPSMWDSFKRGKEKQLWYNREVLKMLKESWQHPLINEYEILLKRGSELE